MANTFNANEPANTAKVNASQELEYLQFCHVIYGKDDIATAYIETVTEEKASAFLFYTSCRAKRGRGVLQVLSAYAKGIGKIIITRVARIYSTKQCMKEPWK